MRIASFNLKDFFDARSADELALVAEKRAHVAQRLRRANADVVALQEVASVALVEGLLTDELSGLGYRSPVFGPFDKRGIGCAIVSRLPIVETKVHSAAELPFPRFVDTDPEPFAQRIPLRRGVVTATVDGGALGPVTVLTVHFKSKLGAPMRTEAGEPIVDPSAGGRAEAALRSLVSRAAEALHLRRIIDQLLLTPGSNVCALGDFNDTIDSLPVQIVRGVGASPETTLVSCLERVPGERRFSVLHRGTPELIDQILVSPALASRLSSAFIDNAELRDHGPHDPNAPLAPDSDHALVCAEFA